MTKQVRVRFAPSPTGYLHVGGLRTALYNFLFARRHNGKFILRIEDTDQSRKVEGAVENLINTLEWTGITYDEGPVKGGDFGTYVQSERLSIYQKHAQDLIEKGDAYYCFCTAERLEEVRKVQVAAKLSTSYDRRCRSLPRDVAEKRKEEEESYVIRMKVPTDGEMGFDDEIRGRVTISYRVLDDQVIIKSDGFPTYHLAVVVDDSLMGITHVIRGEEWLPSTPKHILLYKYFGWDLPVFAHLPLLLNPDKSKLSKRQGDVAVEDYQKKGYLKEALINFVALLGWNPGDEREIFSMEELIEEFSLERVGKSGAVFNIEKLNWMNFEHLRKQPDSKVLEMLRECLIEAHIEDVQFSDEYLLLVIASMRERVSFVKDFLDKSPFFFYPPVSYDEALVKKRWGPESAKHMKEIVEAFAQLTDSKKEEYESALHRTAEALHVRNRELIHPLRLAVSGVGVGPGLYDILFILGRDEVVRRIKKAVEKLG